MNERLKEESGGVVLKSRSIKSLAILLASLNASMAGATTLNSYLRNREGLQKFQAKSYYPAFQDFTRALNDDPLNAEVHLNIARTLEANEEFEKAEKAYKGVLNLLPADSTRRFETLFNLAGVQGKQRKIAEALDTYQAALELDPDSIEVKTNIELLWHQGEGEGEGNEGNEQKEPKDQRGRGEQEKDEPKQPEKKQKKQPKPFESKELSPQDVKKILDEIKNQEQSIRADENDKGAKDAPRDRDW